MLRPNQRFGINQPSGRAHPYQSIGINQPSGRAQMKWHHIPKLKLTRQKRRKSTFWIEKWSESNLDISNVLDTYVEDSWGLY